MPEKSKPLENSEPLDLEYLRALEQTLDEWYSENDDLAYRDL
jgi:hypothetical protein